MARPERTSTVRPAQQTFVPRTHQVPKTTVLNIFRKHEQYNSYLKQTGEQNPRLTSRSIKRFISGLSAAYQRDEKRYLFPGC